MASNISAGENKPIISQAKAVGFIHDRQTFLVLCGIVTVVPIVFVSAFANSRSYPITVDNIFSLLLVMSTMHVALTSFFYYDQRYAVYFKEHKSYYIFLPVIVISATGVGYHLLSPIGPVYIFLFYHAWLLFHYGRQNYGVLCFVGIATKGPRPFRLERVVLYLVPIAGALGAMPLLGQAKHSIFGPYLNLLFLSGAILMVAAFLLLTIRVYYHIRSKQSPWRIFFLVSLASFYLPTFFFDSYFQAVMGYAIAHALQYFVFMVYVVADVNQGMLRRRIMTFLLLAIVGWAVIWMTRNASLWGRADALAAGVGLGIVMSHFIIDAGVWKLSRPFPRRAVRESFSFLFR